MKITSTISCVRIVEGILSCDFLFVILEDIGIVGENASNGHFFFMGECFAIKHQVLLHVSHNAREIL